MVTESRSELLPLFGEWYECADGRAHYFLGGKCLCLRARVAVRAATPAPKRPGGEFTVPTCASCVSLNTKRWQRGGLARA